MTQQSIDRQQTLKDIQKEHESLLLQNNGSTEFANQKVRPFLDKIAQAGKNIENPQERSWLRDLIGYWSGIVNEKSEEMLVVQLQPFDASLIHSRLIRHKMTRRQALIGSGIAGGVLVVGGIVYLEAGRNNPPTPSPTPSPAPNPPSVLITAPRDGSQVSIHTTVQGTAQNIPKDKELWLFIVPSNQAGYFPQPGPIKILGDKWSTGAYFGVARDVGLKFMLIPVLINLNNQEAQNAIKQYFQQSGPVYQGIQPTNGMQLMFPEITVVRV